MSDNEPAGAPVPAEMPSEIIRLRGSIDNIDAALVYLLAERFRVTRRVGELKAVGGLPPADPAREQEQIVRLTSIAEESGLDPAFAEQFRQFIVSEVIRHHELIAAQHKGDNLPEVDTYA